MKHTYIIVKVCGYHDFTDISWEEPVCSVLANTLKDAKRVLAKVKRLWNQWKKVFDNFHVSFHKEHPRPQIGYDVKWFKFYKEQRYNCWNNFTYSMYNQDIRILRILDDCHPEDLKIKKVLAL